MNRAVDHISVHVEKLCRHEVSESSGFDRSAAFGDETFVDLESDDLEIGTAVLQEVLCKRYLACAVAAANAVETRARVSLTQVGKRLAIDFRNRVDREGALYLR